MLPARRNNNQTWMPDIFNDFFDNTWMERPKATCPAINVLEKPDSYQLELAAPGMTKADFDIHLDEDGDLVINMEKKVDAKHEQEKGHYVRREFSYTKFQQTMYKAAMKVDIPSCRALRMLIRILFFALF